MLLMGTQGGFCFQNLVPTHVSPDISYNIGVNLSLNPPFATAIPLVRHPAGKDFAKNDPTCVCSRIEMSGLKGAGIRQETRRIKRWK